MSAQHGSNRSRIHKNCSQSVYLRLTARKVALVQQVEDQGRHGRQAMLADGSVIALLGSAIFVLSLRDTSPVRGLWSCLQNSLVLLEPAELTALTHDVLLDSWDKKPLRRLAFRAAHTKAPHNRFRLALLLIKHLVCCCSHMHGQLSICSGPCCVQQYAVLLPQHLSRQMFNQLSSLCKKDMIMTRHYQVLHTRTAERSTKLFMPAASHTYTGVVTRKDLSLF